MDRVLVAGLDSIAGANLSATLKSGFDVTGICFEEEVSLQGTSSECCSADDHGTLSRIAREVRPQWMIYCGAAADSAWHESSSSCTETQLLARARIWSTLAAQLQVPLTVLSSDGVLTGPRMFHEETSECFCDSSRGTTLRKMEQECLAAHPQTLVARTHVFGWSPIDETHGFAGTLLNHLRTGTTLPLDYLRHGTPLLATDLAEILEQAYRQQLKGLYHISGSERVNPYRFGTMLADQFGLPCHMVGSPVPATARPNLFGGGETSLNCRRIKSDLGMALPMMLESIQRFHAQSLSNFLDQFSGGQQRTPRPMVA